MAISFKTWIKQFREVDAPIGDLARDIKGDKEFPLSTKKEEMYDYLHRKQACAEAKEAFEEAFSKYQSALEKS